MYNVWSAVHDNINKCNNIIHIYFYFRIRVLRYDPGDNFYPHLDGSNIRENGDRSYMSLATFLNEVGVFCSLFVFVVNFIPYDFIIRTNITRTIAAVLYSSSQFSYHKIVTIYSNLIEISIDQ